MNPYAIGIINALLPGLGYVLVSRRVVFGWLLLVGGLALFVALVFLEPVESFFLMSTTPGITMEVIAYVMIAIAFGIDAYNEARAAKT